MIPRLPYIDALIKTVDPGSTLEGGCFTWNQAEAVLAALAAAGLLADPTTSRTDDEQAVINAAIAEREAQLHFGEVHQRVLFHGGHPNESTDARRKWDDAANALAAAVDRLAAPGPKEATP